MEDFLCQKQTKQPKTYVQFNHLQGELKHMISFKLRRFFNKMRTSERGAIKSPKNYLFIAMKNMFDKWQNDILMAEHEAKASA